MAIEGTPVSMVAGAAETASVETAEAIDLAADKNEDPEVGAILHDAALSADKTVARTGWLRRILDKLFSRPD